MTHVPAANSIDLSEMEELKTGDPRLPTIYIDHDCQVFVTTYDGESTELRRALTPEIQQLAERYALEPLWRAIRQPEPFN